MYRTENKLTASASDLVGFLACPHKTTLDLINLDTPLDRAAPDEQVPEDARVGTVDKIQGQEAEAVIISMTTSNGDTLPRYIEFLYSKNRLNVAISRARSLALLVASPALADIPCANVEQMGLVNLMRRAMASTNIKFVQ